MNQRSRDFERIDLKNQNVSAYKKQYSTKPIGTPAQRSLSVYQANVVASGHREPHFEDLPFDHNDVRALAESYKLRAEGISRGVTSDFGMLSAAHLSVSDWQGEGGDKYRSALAKIRQSALDLRSEYVKIYEKLSDLSDALSRQQQTLSVSYKEYRSTPESSPQRPVLVSRAQSARVQSIAAVEDAALFVEMSSGRISKIISDISSIVASLSAEGSLVLSGYTIKSLTGAAIEDNNSPLQDVRFKATPTPSTSSAMSYSGPVVLSYMAASKASHSLGSTWKVSQGDSWWKIADRTLRDNYGLKPTPDEIKRYTEALKRENPEVALTSHVGKNISLPNPIHGIETQSSALVGTHAYTAAAMMVTGGRSAAAASAALGFKKEAGQSAKVALAALSSASPLVGASVPAYMRAKLAVVVASSVTPSGGPTETSSAADKTAVVPLKKVTSASRTYRVLLASAAGD